MIAGRWIVLALALAGCTPTGPALPAVPAERDPGGLTAIDPGTDDAALLSATGCVKCHAEQHADWAESRHAQAWVNRIFQREYRQQPSSWCVHCHAPLAQQEAMVWPPERDQGGGLAAEGVGCASCHVRAGRIVARGHRPGSPHQTIVSPGFGSPAFCAGCHQFEFPVIDENGEVKQLSPHPMQKTVAEFAAGAWASEVHDGCRSCHAATRARHRYQGAHDPSMLERALSLSACRDGDALRLTLANVGAGHAVPTGDLHRHLTLRAWRASAPEKLFDGFLGRRFEPDAERGGKKTVWDSSLKVREQRRYRIPLADLGGRADEAVDVELRYVFVSDEEPPARGPDPLGDEPHHVVVDQLHLELAELKGCAP